MSDLTVDRLLARYHDVDPVAAARFDDALAELAADALASAVLECDLGPAAAVCIPALSIEIALDHRQPSAALARAWAAAIVAAIESGVRGIDEGGETAVVYRQEIDAVVDLVRSVAAGDLSRLWAWQEIGLVPRRAGALAADDVAEVLVTRAAMVPGVLRSFGRDTVVPLTIAGWLAVAAAVAQLLGSRPVAMPARPAGDGADDSRRAAALVPAAVWRRADVSQRWALAVLALVTTAPARCRSATAVSEVLAIADETSRSPLTDSASGPTSPARRGASTGAGAPRRRPAVEASVRSEAPSPAVEARDPGPEPLEQRSASPSPLRPPADPDGALAETEWAGVFFLLHPMRDLGWEEAPMPALLARAVAAVTGAPAGDLAVRLVAGCDDDEIEDADPEAIDVVAGTLRAAVDERLRDLVGEEHEDAEVRRWIWHRPATVAAQPGWIEVTLRLDDVDVGLRMAGLDLDPGFVWWLGSIVTFRYA